MKKLVLFITLLALFTSLGFGQCYQEFLAAGDQAFATRNYESAIDQYKAASRCQDMPNGQQIIIAHKIEEAQQGRIRVITEEKEKARAAQLAAEESERKAQRLRKEAETATALAQLQATITWANRIAFNAAQELEHDSIEDAIALAYIAYDTLNFLGKSDGRVKESFGQAVYENYKQILSAQPIMMTKGYFSEDNSFIFTRTNNNTGIIWNRSGEQVAELKDYKGAISAVAFSPNNDQVIIGSTDHSTRLVNLNDGSRGAGGSVEILKDHAESITGAAFSPDGNRILTWSRDHTARIWDTSGDLKAELIGHLGPILDAKYSQDGQYLFTRGNDQNVIVWDANGIMVTDEIRHLGHIYAAEFNKDGRSILTAGADGDAVLWDINGKILQRFEHKGQVVSIATFSPSYEKILTATTSGQVRIWQANSKSSPIAFQSDQTGILLKGGFGPQGDKIYILDNKHTVHLWNLSGDRIAALDKHRSRILSANFSVDGRYFLTAATDGTAKLWDMYGDVIMNQEDDEAHGQVTATFSPDGKQILTIFGNGKTVLTPIPDEIYEQLKLIGTPPLSDRAKEKYLNNSEKVEEAKSGTTSNAPVATYGPYKVQIGAYRNPREFKYHELKGLGLFEDRKKRNLTIIYIGGILNEQDARYVLSKVKAVGHKDAYIVKDEDNQLKRVR